MTDSEAIDYLDEWLGYHLDENPSWDMDIRASIQEADIPVPIWYLYLSGVTIFVWRKPEMSLNLVETYPYAPDGSHPTVIFQLGWIELMFDSKPLYKFL